MRRPAYLRAGLSAPEAMTILAVLALGVGLGLLLLGRELDGVAPLAEGPAAAPPIIARDLPAGNPASNVFSQELAGHLDAAETSQQELRRRKALRKLEALGGVPADDRADDINAFDPSAAIGEPDDVSPDAVRELLGIEPTTKSTISPGRPSTKSSTPTSRGAQRGPQHDDILPSTGQAARTPTDQQAGQRTLDYWNALNEIIATEEGLRQPPAGGVSAANAQDYLTRRTEAGRYAASEIRGLATLGVDPQAVKLAGELATWYETGVELNEEASGLLTHGSESARRGQPGQRWSQAEKSHQQSVKQLNARAATLRDALTRKYALRFPPLR